MILRAFELAKAMDFGRISPNNTKAAKLIKATTAPAILLCPPTRTIKTLEAA